MNPLPEEMDGWLVELWPHSILELLMKRVRMGKRMRKRTP
jgi:hypothetical protein